MLIAQRKDEQLFTPSNSIATMDNAITMDNTTTLDAVVDNVTTLHTMQLAEGGGSHVQQLHTSKPLAAIDEDVVNDSITEDVLQTQSSTQLIVAVSDNESSKRTNSDITVALKEILNMDVPDFTSAQIPSTVRERKFSELEILGDRTREHLNNLYRSNLLGSARNKAFKIGNKYKYLFTTNVTLVIPLQERNSLKCI